MIGMFMYCVVVAVVTVGCVALIRRRTDYAIARETGSRKSDGR